MADVVKKKCKPFIAGPTMMMDIQLTDELKAAILEKLKPTLPKLSDLKEPTPNSAPYKGAKMSTPPVVVETDWTGERFPNRAGHVTIIPFNEFKDVSDEQKTALSEQEIEVEVLPNLMTWLRGSPGNAAAGCKGIFYGNVVLSDETVAAIKKARVAAGLPEMPPTPPQALNGLDLDLRLGEFKFHMSIAALMPTWADEIDEFGKLDAAAAQVAMTEMTERLEEWAQRLRIVPNLTGLGNKLELTKVTVKPKEVGPTMIVDLGLSDELAEAMKHKTTMDLQFSFNGTEAIVSCPNSAPYKGVKMGGAKPEVGKDWSGERFPQRPGHVTIVPFNEFKDLTDEQKEKLLAQEITTELDVTQVFYLRGSPANAAAGCKGVFYVNWVLTEDTVDNLKSARANAGLAELPPVPDQAMNEIDLDERLFRFHFHKSFTSLMPKFAHEIDDFKTLEKDAAQEAMNKMTTRIEAWARKMRIVRIPGPKPPASGGLLRLGREEGDEAPQALSGNMLELVPEGGDGYTK